MPVYEYKCPKCGIRTEQFAATCTPPDGAKCGCGGHVRRVYGADFNVNTHSYASEYAQSHHFQRKQEEGYRRNSIKNEQILNP